MQTINNHCGKINAIIWACHFYSQIDIQIKVFDYDWGLQDDFMGSASLDLTTLELSRVTELMIPLEDAARPTGTNAASKSMLTDIFHLMKSN